MTNALHRFYAYDDIGNRETSQEGAGAYQQGHPNPYLTTYTPNAFNQYSQTSKVIAPPDGLGGDAFTYDLDGNMTQDGDCDYAWDGENRLIAVTPRTYEAGSKKLVFDYDYQSRRIRKRVYTYDGDECLTTPTTDLRFVYDGWNLLMELDGLNSNAVLRKYTWSLDLSGTLQAAGGVGGLLAVYDTAGTTSTSDDASYGYLYDTNGNVWQLVDFSDGSLAAKYEYDPYGGPLLDAANATQSGAYAATNPFRFSTKYFDGEVDYSNTANDGLYYYGYRYYSPRMGRWLNRDPIEENGSMNLYGAFGNSAIAQIDALGMEPSCSFPPAPPLEQSGGNITRGSDDIWSPWTRWLIAREGGQYEVNPDSSWGRYVRGLSTTSLLEEDAQKQIRHQLASRCDCKSQGGETMDAGLTGGPFKRGTWDADGFWTWKSIGGLHLDYSADCKIKNCCKLCKVSCTITYHAFDNFHFDINPKDTIHTHFGSWSQLNNYMWHLHYQKVFRFTLPCSQESEKK